MIFRRNFFYSYFLSTLCTNVTLFRINNHDCTQIGSRKSIRTYIRGMYDFILPFFHHVCVCVIFYYFYLHMGNFFPASLFDQNFDDYSWCISFLSFFLSLLLLFVCVCNAFHSMCVYLACLLGCLSGRHSSIY